MKFLVSDELKKEIETVLAEEGARCAVAFWGKGANKKLAQSGQGDFKIICNLASGGTNPSVIEKLPRKNVMQCDTLHAKVFIGQSTAVIASANASANGLGLEGIEQARWIEAGVRLHEYSDVSEWFDRLWNSGARPITDADLTRAKEAWSMRQKWRPTRIFIESFNAEGEDTPLLYWWCHADFQVNKKGVREYLGDFSPEIEASIEDGLQIDGHEDEKALKAGTWVLQWQLRNNGRPSGPLSWFYTDKKIPKAYKYKGKGWRDTIICAEQMPNVPFKLSEPGVSKVFFEVLSHDDFSDLRQQSYPGAWFTPERIRKMKKFWPAFKKRCLEIASAKSKSM